jgi:hypothetical protein
MPRVQGDNLELSNLKAATGNTATSNYSIATAAGTTTGPIAFSDFTIDAVTSTISGFTYVKESTAETFNMNFTNAGSRFLSRVGSQYNNFTWSLSAGAEFSLQSLPPYNPSVTANAVGNSSTLVSPTARTLTATFRDLYNDQATNYNVAMTKTIYNVDDYAGASGLCLHLDEMIEMWDGTFKKAGDLVEEDVVKAYYPPHFNAADDFNFYDWEYYTPGGILVPAYVKDVAYTFVDRWNKITTSKGDVRGNGEHPMMVWDMNEEVYKFKPLGLLQPGDKLIKVLGENQIEEVEILTNEVQNSVLEVVSIDVEDVDTYIVNGFVTHNKGANSLAGYSISTNPTISIVATTIGGDAYRALTLSTNSAVVSPGSTAITANFSYDIQIASDSGFATILATFTAYSSNTLNYKTGSTIFARAKTNFAGLQSNFGSTATG